MLQPKSITLILTASLALGACREFSIYDDYLQLPKGTDLEVKYHRDVRDALLKLNVSEDTDEAEIFRLVQKNAADKSDPRHQIFESLLIVPNHHGTGSKQLARVVKSIMALARAEPEQVVFNKLAQSQRLIDNLTKHSSWFMPARMTDFDRKIIAQFDGMFIKALQTDKPDKKISLYDLTGMLPNVSLSEDQFNVDEMIHFAFRHVYSPTEDLGAFEIFMDHKCGWLVKHFPMLELVDIARALGSYHVVYDPVKRTLEYHRMCLAWRKEGHDPIMKNLAKQLKED